MDTSAHSVILYQSFVQPFYNGVGFVVTVVFHFPVYGKSKDYKFQITLIFMFCYNSSIPNIFFRLKFIKCFDFEISVDICVCFYLFRKYFNMNNKQTIF